MARETTSYLRWSADLARSDTIARLPGRMRFASAYWRQRIIGSAPAGDGPPPPPPPPPPFSPVPVAQAGNDRFYYGSGDRFEIAMRDRTGALAMLIRAAEPRRPVTSELMAALEAELADQLPQSTLRDAYRRLIAEAPRPDSLPPYDRFVLDRTGALWVRQYKMPGATSLAWYVFDDAGRWLTKLELPGDFEVRDIGRDYLIAFLRDSLDVEIVRMYGLKRVAR
jgi:hypothetical protein